MTPAGMAPCKCQREKAIQRELPPRYQQARLTDFSTGVRECVTRWIENPGDGLLLSGTTGSGKTHLAAALLRELIKRGQKCTFRRIANLYQDLRESFRLNTSEAEILSPYLASPLIVLDDLGSGALSDMERRAALQIIDVRLNSLRPTIITTNLDLEEISAKIDDRVASRLGTYVNVRLAGADRRLADKKSPGQPRLFASA